MDSLIYIALFLLIGKILSGLKFYKKDEDEHSNVICLREQIKNVKNDKYAGRIDANVFDAAGRDVGSILVKEKIGRPYSGGKRLSWCDNNK